MLMISVVAGLILISIWIGFYALAKQQGRILLRLDQIEDRAKVAGTGPENLSDQTEPDGLPLKRPFPAFMFPDLRWRPVAFGDFRDQCYFLVLWYFVFCFSY